MKKIFAITLVTLLTASLTAGAAVKPPKGFKALFNGENLDGWWGLKTEDPAKWMALSEEDFKAKKEASIKDIHEHWTVEGDELVNDGHGLYLSTEKNYGDFELLIDYKTVAQADSGIYLRGIPQVQIWDYTEAGGKWKLGADKGSGGLWNNSPGADGKDPLVLADKPFGEWNSFRIIMVGERVTIFLNNQLVVDHARLENYFNRKGTLPAKGPIQLQTHGGEIRWRNVYIREIGSEEANKILSSHGNEGFTPAFNGKDLSGWAGAVDNYEVKDGAIVCKPGKGGTLFTKEIYGDFKARVEFQLPPGGNNGLSIRYPGKGHATYNAMTELQILDDTAEKYAKLDPRQYHGSVYSLIAAERGFLRPLGEWNFQEVSVVGSTIKVELNGTVILNADVSQVKEGMYEMERYKGLGNTEGHFGFAGHNEPVAFRLVELKKL